MGITVVLSSGDFVHDTKSGDIGFLIARQISRTHNHRNGYALMVWRIYWCREGETRYTEESVIKMVQSGHLILYASN